MPKVAITDDPIEKQFIPAFRKMNRDRRENGDPELEFKDYMERQYSGKIGRWSDRKPEPRKEKRRKAAQKAVDLAKLEKLNKERLLAGHPPISEQAYRRDWCNSDD